MLDEMFLRNTSRFAIFFDYKNHCIFFQFSILFFGVTLIWSNVFWPKNKVARNEKQKKLYVFSVFVFQKYGKFLNISLEH